MSAAQYVRLQAISEQGGNPWASVAELNVLDATNAAISRSGWTVSADSQETVGENAAAINAIDGDPDSIWHTQWKGASPPLPHSLTINLGAARSIGGFKYLPRQIGVNGRIAGWRFYTSTDAVAWMLVAEGVFPDGAAEQTVLLASSAQAGNRSPVLAALVDRTDALGKPVTQALIATDADGDPLTYTVAGLPTGLVVDPATGLISGTPSALGTFNVIVQVSDSRGATVAGNFDWTVSAAASAGVMAQYVRLESLSEVNGNPWASVAEFNVLDDTATPIPRDGWIASADSQEMVGENSPASNAIDGDRNSFWHTQWDGGSPALPHSLMVNMGVARVVGGFKYLPRQIGTNGRIADWKFYTSNDGANWTLASQGTFPDGTDEQTVVLPVPQNSTGTISGTGSDASASNPGASTASGGASAPATSTGTPTVPPATTPDASSSAVRFVRLESDSEVNGNPWASIAEFNVLSPFGTVQPRAGWKVTADSVETIGENGEAINAIDGDPNSYWHTQWTGSSPIQPHTLTIDMGAAQVIGGFRYLPRQTGVNGRIATWRFFSSIDGITWAQIGQGSFANSSAEQSYMLTASQASAASTATALRASRVAAFASGPLVAASPWKVNEAVTPGTVRRLSSGQHVTFVVAGTTGSVEPGSGAGLLDGRPVVDGSTTAYFNGRILAVSLPGAPIMGSSPDAASAGLTQVNFAAGNFQPPRYATAQGCKALSVGTSFIGHYCYANGSAAGSGNATAFASGRYGAGLPTTNTYHANSWEEEFVVTDQYFGLVFANSSSPVNIEIDGVEVQAGPTISSGVEGWTLTFNYQGVTKSRVVRVISGSGSVLPTLRGVALSASGTVSAGAPPSDQLLVFGDSINATVVPASEAGFQIMTYWVQRYLGFGSVINMAVGGSGYVSQNPNTYNLPSLLSNPTNVALIASYGPTITHVLIGAGFNDRFQSPATVQANALASWKAIRALLPNAKISITDGWSGSSGPDANAIAMAATLTATFNAWGDSNSRLIHSVGTSASTAYISGTGNVGLPIASGNSSQYTSTDAVHPSPAGAQYIGRRISDDISSAWGGAY